MRRAREIAIALGGLAALTVGAFVASSHTGVREEAPGVAGSDAVQGAVGAREAVRPGSVADPGPRGARALYLLLGRLGHRVELRTNRTKPIAGERVRIVLGRAAPLDAATLAWVGRGNTLVQAPPPPGEAPGERLQGAGRLVFLRSADMLSNASLARDPEPAVLMAAVCATNAHGGVVTFDESLRDARSLAATFGQFPVAAAVLQAILALLLLVWAKAPRFGPVLAVGGSDPPPLAVEQVTAIADLNESAGAATLAGRVLAARFRQGAALALGLPSGADDEALAERFCARFGGERDELVGLLSRAAEPGIGHAELGRVARGLAAYERRMRQERGRR